MNTSNVNYLQKCLICNDYIKLEDNYTLSECYHSYHFDCISKWFMMGKPNCPHCNCPPNYKYFVKSKK